MLFKVINPPASEPVSVDTAAGHLRLSTDEKTAESSLLSQMIAAAREAAEHETGRALITRTLRLDLDDFPRSPYVALELGMPPVIGIVDVTYRDMLGATQTMPDTDYSLDTSENPGWVVPAYGITWPDVLVSPGAVKVTFTAGYGANASDVPTGIIQWMLLRIGTLYRFREEFVSGAGLSALALPNRFVDCLLDPYRTMKG